MRNMNLNELLTLKQAENKGYGNAHALFFRIRNGTLKGIKIGQAWLVSEEELKKWKDRRYK